MLENEYKEPDMLPKINKSDMEGIVEAIKECLKSNHDIEKAQLACIVRKMIIPKTNGNYLLYATSNEKMITKMLHLPK